MTTPSDPPAVPPAVDRRRAERVRPGPIRVRLHRTCEGILVDISETGALVQIPSSLSPETPITLNLELGDVPIELRARVVRSNAHQIQLPAATLARNEYHVGLEFSDLAEDQMLALGRLIRSE